MTAQVMQVQFLGVDEGADPKALPPGTLLRAENCAMDKHRRLVKRDGTLGLAKTRFDSGSVSAGTRMLPYPGGDIGICDGATAFTRNALATPTWAPLPFPVTPFALETRPIATAARGIDYVDQVVSGNLLFVVYQTTTAGSGVASNPPVLFFRVDNLATGRTVSGPTKIDWSASYQRPRIVLGASKAIIVWHAPNRIYACTVSLTTFAMGATVTLANDSPTSTVYDAAIGTSSAGEVLYIVYVLAAGAARVQVRSFTTTALAADQSLTVASSGTGADSCDIAFLPLANKVAVVWSSSSINYVLATILTVDLVSSTGATQVTLGAANRSDYCFIAEDSATHCVIGWQNRSTSYPEGIVTTGKVDIATLTLALLTTRSTFRLYAPSKPWKINSRWFFAATVLTVKDGTTTEGIPSASVVVCEIEFSDGVSGGYAFPHVHVATLENLTGWLQRTSPSHITKPATAGSVCRIPASYRLREPANDGQIGSIPIGWNLHKLTTYVTVGDLVDENDDLLRAAPIGQGLLLAGASTMWADGVTVMPYGFQHAPKIHSVTAVTGGGLLAGTYSYIAVYAWTDALGVKHRSAPSPAMTGATTGADLTLEVLVCTASLSSKQRSGLTGIGVASPVTIELYRTTIGGTSSHYKLIETDGINDPVSSTITLTDALPDSDVSSSGTVTLASQEQLYTELGELANIPPPASVTATTHRGRLWVLDSTRRTAWASKVQAEDSLIAPGFNVALSLGFDSDKYAFGSLDDKLVVFGANDIDVVYGRGPDATGQNNDWQVQRVQTDVGCSYPRSVVTCPKGVAFLSSRGIELLDRGLNITWVGRAIQTTLASYPTITSAVLVPEHEEIRFTCQDSSGVSGNGIILAYDYVAEMWFTRPYTDGATTYQTFVDAALVDGVYTMLTDGGKVYQEDATYSLDDWAVTASWVPIDVILAPVAPAGNLAWHRVKDVTIMGTSVTNHDLKVSVARDYATSYEQDNTFLAGSTATTIGPLEKCRVTMQNQKCQAIQIRIQDTTPTSPGTYPVSTGDGPILESVAFRVSVRPGVAKTASGQRG